jgi:hypothetical protein
MRVAACDLTDSGRRSLRLHSCVICATLLFDVGGVVDDDKEILFTILGEL